MHLKQFPTWEKQKYPNGNLLHRKGHATFFNLVHFSKNLPLMRRFCSSAMAQLFSAFWTQHFWHIFGTFSPPFVQPKVVAANRFFFSQMTFDLVGFEIPQVGTVCWILTLWAWPGLLPLLLLNHQAAKKNMGQIQIIAQLFLQSSQWSQISKTFNIEGSLETEVTHSANEWWSAKATMCTWAVTGIFCNPQRSFQFWPVLTLFDASWKNEINDLRQQFLRLNCKKVDIVVKFWSDIKRKLWKSSLNMTNRFSPWTINALI